MNYLVSVANALNVGSGSILATFNFTGQFEWLNGILATIQPILWAILIVAGAAGSIYAVILGVNMARADSTEKREEAKKRLINVIVAIAITVALILFFQLLIAEEGILANIFKDMQKVIPPAKP